MKSKTLNREHAETTIFREELLLNLEKAGHYEGHFIS